MLRHLLFVATVNQASSNSPATPSSRFQVLDPEAGRESWRAKLSPPWRKPCPGRSAVAHSLSEAQQLVVDQKPALFVLDVDATYDLAQEFIYDLRTSHPECACDHSDRDSFHRATRAGRRPRRDSFLEKPFPRADFITLVEALLAPGGKSEGERFRDAERPAHRRYHPAQVHQRRDLDARVYRSERREGPRLF